MSDSIRNRLVVDSCRTEDGIFLIEQFLKELGIKNFKCNIYNDNIINEIPSTIKKFRRNREINKILE